jgi:hypothetical protein
VGAAVANRQLRAAALNAGPMGPLEHAMEKFAIVISRQQ